MRWGHRKAVPESYTSSKARYKAAKKAFNRSHSRAYNYSAFHLMSQFTNPKKKAKADRLWEQAKKDGKNFNAAQKEYKREKARTADQRSAIRKERVKTAAKVGAVAGAAALAAYGGYKLHNIRKANTKAVENYVKSHVKGEFSQVRYKNGGSITTRNDWTVSNNRLFGPSLTPTQTKYYYNTPSVISGREQITGSKVGGYNPIQNLASRRNLKKAKRFTKY